MILAIYVLGAVFTIGLLSDAPKMPSYKAVLLSLFWPYTLVKWIIKHD